MDSRLNKFYKSPWWALNGYVETIVPALFRKTPALAYQIKKFELPDGDELWLSWKTHPSKRLVVIVPGLESDSSKSYIKNLSLLLYDSGFDILVPEHRGGVKVNKLYRSYHSGNTGDLDIILSNDTVKSYDKVFLVGFSLGGNIVLKYLGEKNKESGIYKAAAISTPFDLNKCSAALEMKKNYVFSRRFLRSMKKRLKEKVQYFPKSVSQKAIDKCNSVRAFDDLYTAPAHGFENAQSYYRACSSRYFLNNITNPTLIINALNDPMIPLDNGMLNELSDNPFLYPVIPSKGGHLGFPNPRLNGANWYEKKVLEFFQEPYPEFHGSAGGRYQRETKV